MGVCVLLFCRICTSSSASSSVVSMVTGVGAMTWSPLACGIITGKYENGIPESSRASMKVGWTRPRTVGSSVQLIPVQSGTLPPYITTMSDKQNHHGNHCRLELMWKNREIQIMTCGQTSRRTRLLSVLLSVHLSICLIHPTTTAAEGQMSEQQL